MSINEDKKEILTYKGKPLVRRGDEIFYGDPNAKYILHLQILDKAPLMDISVAKKIAVQLLHNNDSMSPKQKLIKKAEREGLYAALDIGVFWLEDAIEQSK